MNAVCTPDLKAGYSRGTMFNKPLFILAHELWDLSFYSSYRHLVKNQWRPADDLRAEQNRQLRTMIRYCYENVPYYHRLFKDLGLLPASIENVSDLQKLPVLTKDIIKKNWDALKPVTLHRIRYQEQATGGSTGTPMRYRISTTDRFLGGALLYRGWGYGGYSLGDRTVFLAGSSLDTGAGTGLITMAHEFSRNIRRLSSFDMGRQQMKSYASLIMKWKPKFIRGYPSSISTFCDYLKEENISLPSPAAVFTTSEKIYPPIRQKISRYFNAPVFDGYGLNDGGVSAYECSEHHGLHIDMERSIMEIIDDGGNAVESGDGTILATSLYNFAMPLIRYNTGDLATLSDEPCPCGRAYPLLSEIIGRSADVLITPEGTKVHGWFFLYIFWEYGEGIKEYQVVQKSLGELQIYIVREEGFSEEKLERIRQIIREKSPLWKISFIFADAIKRTGSGKYKFIINEIPI